MTATSQQAKRDLGRLVRRIAVRWGDALRSRLAVLTMAMVASFLCALFVSQHSAAVAIGTGLILAGGLSWPWLSLRTTQASLEYSTRRTVEQMSVEVRATIRNRGWLPVSGLTIKDPMSSQTDETESFSASLATVRGCSTSEFRWPWVPTRRGIYPLGVPELSTDFPFGLWRVRRPMEVRGSLIVWPHLVNLPFAVVARGRDGQDHVPIASSPKTGTGLPEDVRVYRPGDSPRSIHWPLTARFDKLMIRPRTLAVDRQAVVTLDLSGVESTSASHRLAEGAIRVAATVCRELLDQGTEVCFRCAAFEQWVRQDSRSWQFWMDRLAGLTLDECATARPTVSDADRLGVYCVSTNPSLIVPRGTQLVLIRSSESVASGVVDARTIQLDIDSLSVARGGSRVPTAKRAYRRTG